MVKKIDKIYDSNFHPESIIGQVDRNIKKTFLKRMSNNSVFLDTTWLHINSDLEKFIRKNRTKTFLAYSGPDWENSVCRHEAHEWLKSFNIDIKHIGNSNSEYYFSFWLEFIRLNISKYDFDYSLTDINKVFMSLNRKPHEHRILLVKEFYNRNLTNDGYISLGVDNESVRDYRNLPVPIKLNRDITNNEGDESVSGNAGGITNDISSLGNIDNWKSHFVNIVSETTVHTDVFLSEKIFKPILGYKPFMVLGDANVYNKLHKWGIDTFDDIFGTGYKEENNYTKHIKWIASTVEELKKEDLNKLYTKILPRLIANKKNLVYAAKQNHAAIDSIAGLF